MQLKNNYIRLTLDPVGAELKGLYNIETGKEVMWNGDATWWSGISPLLFPFIGTSKDHKYTYEDKTYDMRPHGFIKDREFKVAELTEDAVRFVYTSTESDYEVYPFKFEISVSYTIEWSIVKVDWNVKNLDTKEMLYTIGAHPSFICEDGDVLSFETKGDKTNFYSLEGPLIKDKELMEPKRLELNADAFPIDTWIYDGVKSATLFNVNKGSSVKVTFDDFTYVGVWSPVKNGQMAPFVCIEPWEGLPDYTTATGNLKDKITATKLDPGNEKAYTYSIEIA